MENLLFLLLVVAFLFFRGLPKEKKKQLLLRLEYELYKRGFIEYRD